MGHVVNANGIQPTEEKVQAIKEASEPKNAAELRSFLGLVNYYSKFLPNLSTKLAPLYKKQHWIWGTEQQQAFREARALLQADSLLAYYDPSKPLVVACDASQYGIGAVLSHVLDDETERPFAYVSRTLSTAEKH